MSYTIKEIDQGWRDFLSTLTLSDGAALHILIEKPGPYIAREKLYPAISVNKSTIFPDPERREGEDGDLVIDIYDESVVPALSRTIRKRSPYRIQYLVDVWTAGPFAAKHDAELMLGLFLLMDTNGYLPIVDSLGEAQLLELFQTASMVGGAEEGPEVLYHRSWTYEVHASFVTVGETLGVRAETIHLTVEKAETITNDALDQNDTVIDITLELP